MLSFYDTHPDLAEITELNSRGLSIPQHCAQMKAAFQRGNLVSQYYLGRWYLRGVWDGAGMADDLLLDRLQPATVDPLQDPYLVMEKDPSKGLQYLKAFINQCQVRNRWDLDELKYQAIDLVHKHSQTNDTTMLRPSSNQNSFQLYFQGVAKQNLFYTGLPMGVLIVLMIGWGWWGWSGLSENDLVPIVPITGIWILFIFLPLTTVLLYIYHYGIKKGLPLCTCKATVDGINRITFRLSDRDGLGLPDRDRIRHLKPFQSSTRHSFPLFSTFYWLLIPVLSLLLYLVINYVKKKCDTWYIPLIGECYGGAFMYSVLASIYCAIVMAIILMPTENGSHLGCKKHLESELNPIKD